MWLILDLIIVAIIILYVYLCFKRGFVRTVIELVGYILAIYLSFTFGGILTNVVYDEFVEPAIVETVADEINLSADENIDKTVDSIWNSLPEFIVNAAETFDVTSDTLRDTIKDGYENNADATTFAKNATEAIAKPIVVPLIKTIISLILFIILMFVVKFLAKIINRAFNIPIIGRLNRLLGGFVGLFKGLIISFVFVMMALFIMTLFEDGFLFFTNENVEQTVLFKFLAGFSPFK